MSKGKILYSIRHMSNNMSNVYRSVDEGWYRIIQIQFRVNSTGDSFNFSLIKDVCYKEMPF